MKNYWDDYPWTEAEEELKRLSPSDMESAVWAWRARFTPGAIIERTFRRFGIDAGLRGVVVEIRQPVTLTQSEFTYLLVRWTDGTRTTPNPLLFKDTKLVGHVPADWPLDELEDFQEFELPPTP